MVHPCTQRSFLYLQRVQAVELEKCIACLALAYRMHQTVRAQFRVCLRAYVCREVRFRGQSSSTPVMAGVKV